jgi:hypothetical protein
MPGSDGVYGTADDEWKTADRSLNIDSPYTFQGAVFPRFTNIISTPGVKNYGLDFCAFNMRYRSGSIIQEAGTECPKVVKGVAGDPAANGAGGYLAYGPYIENLKDNAWYKVTARVKVANDNSSGRPIFRLDGSFKENYTTPSISIGSKSFVTSDVTLNGYANYTINFFKSPGYKIGEFRVYSFNNADITIDSIKIQETTPSNQFVYEGENMHFWNTALISNENIVEAGSSKGMARKSTGSGWVNFGPRTPDQTGGKWYRAEFALKVDTTTNPDEKGIILEANNSNGGYGILGRKEVRVSELANNQYRNFSLIYYKPDNVGLMEYRVRNLTSMTTYLDKVTVTEISKPLKIENMYEAELNLNRGSLVKENGVIAMANSNLSWTSFGQYTNDLPTAAAGFGTYRASYCIRNSGGATGVIGRYGIFKGTQALITAEISSSNLTTQGRCGTGYFEFITPNFSITTLTGDNLDFRFANWAKGNETRIDNIKIFSI